MPPVTPALAPPPAPAFSSATPSPERELAWESHESEDAASLVLATLFARQTSWTTQVLCEPYRAFEPPTTIPPTYYYGTASASETAWPGGACTDSMLLCFSSVVWPDHVPQVLQERWRHAVDQLWQCVMRGGTYAALLTDCLHDVREALAEAADAHSGAPLPPKARSSVVEAIWARQSSYLYGAVAAALRSMLGLVLRMNLVRGPY